jgi:PAS domain S-box-containing protein
MERALHALCDAVTIRDVSGDILFQNLAAQQPAAQALDTDFITTQAVLLPQLPRSREDACLEQGVDAASCDCTVTVRSSMSWTNPLVRRILDSLPHFVWHSSARTGAVEWHNKWWYDYTGLQPGAACGSGWEQMLHPEDRERVRAAWPTCVATRSTYRVELRMRAADGSYRWFLTCGQPLYNDAGVLARWLGTVSDITAQKELQQELEAERALLVTALDQLPVSVLVAAAPSGQLRFVNKKTAEVFRHPP